MTTFYLPIKHTVPMEQDSIFDKITPREGTSCIKWDFTPHIEAKDKEKDVIPLWVADMDFQVAEPILNQLQKRISHGILGYTM